MIADVFLRAVPEVLLAGIRSGHLHVTGSIIREVATGRIAGFLQETGGLGAIVGRLNPCGIADLAVDTAGHAATRAGLAQVKARIAAVRHLQLVALALDGVGIGVTIAGIAWLDRRIARLRRASMRSTPRSGESPKMSRRAVMSRCAPR